jgi:NAD(P)-dependent dehydrogenase (short-subunit alcohol dehydrogenase family)
MTTGNVLVTGASKGIGAAIAQALGAAGFVVVAHYGADEAGALDATREIPAERKHVVQADLADPAAPGRLWHEAIAACGHIDVLVNNAAVMPSTRLDAADAEWQTGWDEALQVNLRAPADLIRAAVPHFVERGGGVLVSISSWVAQRGPRDPSLIAYSASKSGLKTITQAVARHHARDGVLAYVIAPGVVGTSMSRISAERTGGVEKVFSELAMGEWVPPSEIGDLVVFLAERRARHLTGATFDVNGATYVR